MEGTVTITTDQYDLFKQKSKSLDLILNDPKSKKIVLTDRVGYGHKIDSIFTIVNGDELEYDLRKEIQRLLADNYSLRSQKSACSDSIIEMSKKVDLLEKIITELKSKWWYRLIFKR